MLFLKNHKLISWGYKFLQHHYLFGCLVLWYIVTWSWLLQTDALVLTGSSSLGTVLAFFCLLFVVAVSVLIIWLAFRSVNKINHRDYDWAVIIFAFLFFATADWLVSWLVAIIWIGPQGSLDTVLPLGSPALLLTQTPLRFIARLIGFYGLSSLVWTFAYILTKKTLRRYLPAYIATIVILAIVSFQIYRPTNLSPIEAMVVNESLTQRLPAIQPGQAKLVVFPEYGFDDIDYNNLPTRIAKSDNKTYFVGSRQLNQPEKVGHINQVVFGDTNNGITKTEAKHRLIPNGEDASYIMQFGLVLFNQKGPLDFFKYNRQVIKNVNQLQPFAASPDIILGSAVCSSVTSPQDYQQLTRDGATILTNSASLDIFKGSRIFNWEQLALAKFMAVANARPFLQAANDSSSYAIDADGNLINKIESNGSLSVTISPNKQRSLYSLLGEWPALIGGIFAIALAIIFRFSKPSNKK